MGIKHGINPLGYAGVTANRPPNLVMYPRDPEPEDGLNSSLGTIWLHTGADRVFVLVDSTNLTRTWLRLLSAGGDVGDLLGFVGDDALAIAPDIAGEVTISGGRNIETYEVEQGILGIRMSTHIATGGTINPVVLTTAIMIAGMVTDANLLGGGLVGANVAGNLNLTVEGDSGETLIGSTAGDTSWGTITAGSAIEVTNSSHAIEVKTTRGNDGELLIRGANVDPVWAPIIAGEGIIITNTPNGITIEKVAGNNFLPVGTIIEYDEGFPEGQSWLHCDGSAVAQADYPELFNVIGHEYMVPAISSVSSAPGPLNDCAHNGLLGEDGLWVIVGFVGGTDERSRKRFMRSNDGRTWIDMKATLPKMHCVSTVSHNGLPGAEGLWVVRYMKTTTHPNSTQCIMTSQDGITWTQRLCDPSILLLSKFVHNGLPGGAGLWIAGLMNIFPINLVRWYTSTNGINWTLRQQTGGPSRGFQSFAFLNGDIFTEDRSNLYRSTDNGASFKRVMETKFTSPLSSSPTRVMFSRAPKLIYTEDGSKWITINNTADTGMKQGTTIPGCLTYGGDMWMQRDSRTPTAIFASSDSLKEKWRKIELPGAADPRPNNSILNTSITCSNNQAGANSKWLIGSHITYYQSGYKPYLWLGNLGINADTHFYLPYMPGHIILY